jgi:NADPH-dependent curcumin reductase
MKLGESIFKARSVTVKNLRVGDFAADHQEEMLAYVAPLMAAGTIKYREDIRQGLETIPTAFAEMLRDGNFGKTLVQLSPDPTLG